MKITILSDIHGAAGVHERVMKWTDRTLQLGDCGFTYGLKDPQQTPNDPYEYMKTWDPEMHKIIGGNHDNYDFLRRYPHYLGDSGTWNGIFYVRGALSVDKDRRIEDFNWWPEEELTIEEGIFALEAYEKAKPQIVVSHDCPEQCAEKMLRHDQPRHPSRTGQLLGCMFEIHQPKLWVFGHWHVGKKFFLPGYVTDFVALNVEDTYAIEVPDEEVTTD